MGQPKDRYFNGGGYFDVAKGKSKPFLVFTGQIVVQVIDDVDFQQLDISNSPDYAINLRAQAGAWVETADGKYRAYVYVNSIDNAGKSAKISINRYTMK